MRKWLRRWLGIERLEREADTEYKLNNKMYDRVKNLEQTVDQQSKERVAMKEQLQRAGLIQQ